MPQLFRVGDLARQMGMTDRGADLQAAFDRCRRHQAAEDTLDLSTVKSIITGETLQRRPAR